MPIVESIRDESKAHIITYSLSSHGHMLDAQIADEVIIFV